MAGESQYYWKGYKGTLENGATYTHDRFFTQSFLPVSTNASGSHITYSRVVERFQNNGYNEYTFSNNIDQNFINSIDPEKSAYSPFTSTETERGRLISKYTYDEQGHLLREELNNYEYLPARQGEFIRAVATKRYAISGGTAIEGTAYKIISCPYNLTSTWVTTYGTNPRTLMMDSKVSYFYNNYNLVSRTTEALGNGDTIKQVIKYPTDFNYTGPNPLDPVTRAIASMVSLNLLKYPIELVKYRNDKVIGATVTTYVAPNLPNKVYELNNSKPLNKLDYRGPKFGDVAIYGSNIPFIVDPQFRLELAYDKYDSHGNVLQYHNPDGTNISFVWGYNSSYPIAKIENASYDQLTGVLGEQVITQLNGTGLSDEQVRQKTAAIVFKP